MQIGTLYEFRTDDDTLIGRLYPRFYIAHTLRVQKALAWWDANLSGNKHVSQVSDETMMDSFDLEASERIVMQAACKRYIPRTSKLLLVGLDDASFNGTTVRYYRFMIKDAYCIARTLAAEALKEFGT